ncbi:MAG: HAD hydrolase-like protein [Firmicutes bacterium]|nr:HAD hydrolase-like protein [Bacillota bacterium]
MSNNHSNRLPLFDIDGTILKSGNKAHHDAFTTAFQGALDITPDLKVIRAAGMLDRNIIKEILEMNGLSPADHPEKIEEVLERMRSHFTENAPDMKDRVLPGVRETLAALKEEKIPAGLLTGNVETIAWVKMQRAGLYDLLDKFGGFGDMMVTQRAELIPIAVEHANRLTGNGFKPEDVVIIGDTPRDIDCARQGGAKVIAVATGYYPKDVLGPMNPDLLIDDMSDFGKVVDFIAGR